MNAFIETVSSNPVFLVVFIIILAVILYSLLKKLFKLALIALIAIIIFFGYIYLTEDKPEQKIQNYIEQGAEALDDVKDKAKEVGSDIKDKVDDYKKSGKE